MYHNNYLAKTIHLYPLEIVIKLPYCLTVTRDKAKKSKTRPEKKKHNCDSLGQEETVYAEPLQLIGYKFPQDAWRM